MPSWQAEGRHSRGRSRRHGHAWSRWQTEAPPPFPVAGSKRMTQLADNGPQVRRMATAVKMCACGHNYLCGDGTLSISRKYRAAGLARSPPLAAYLRVMNIAFYAPLKSPHHPVPSGDRLMARQLMAALTLAGHSVTVASEFRSFLPS